MKKIVVLSLLGGFFIASPHLVCAAELSKNKKNVQDPRTVKFDNNTDRTVIVKLGDANGDLIDIATVKPKDSFSHRFNDLEKWYERKCVNLRYIDDVGRETIDGTRLEEIQGRNLLHEKFIYKIDGKVDDDDSSYDSAYIYGEIRNFIPKSADVKRSEIHTEVKRDHPQGVPVLVRSNKPGNLYRR